MRHREPIFSPGQEEVGLCCFGKGTIVHAPYERKKGEQYRGFGIERYKSSGEKTGRVNHRTLPGSTNSALRFGSTLMSRYFILSVRPSIRSAK
jgi:hypothetical protein